MSCGDERQLDDCAVVVDTREPVAAKRRHAVRCYAIRIALSVASHSTSLRVGVDAWTPTHWARRGRTQRGRGLREGSGMNWTGLAGRLERKFGLGDNAFAARKVYSHVERLCHQYGDRVYVIVRDMVDYADRAGKPGTTFRAFVLKRIQEHGYNVAKSAAGPNAPTLLAEVDDVRSRIGAPRLEVEPREPKPSSTAVRDGSATLHEVGHADEQLRREVERLRLSNQLLQRDLAATRAAREGGVR